MSTAGNDLLAGFGATRSRGFSLLEVLVAFAVLALCLGVLYKSLGGSTRAVEAASQTERATLWARSILGRWPQTGLAGWNEAGVTSDGFRWAVHSRAYPLGLDTRKDWALYEVEVLVAWGNAPRERRVRLYSIRPQVAPEGVAN